jgi:nucleotide-binding universal stress UspA family protein
VWSLSATINLASGVYFLGMTPWFFVFIFFLLTLAPTKCNTQTMDKAFKKILVAYDNSSAAKSSLQSAVGVSLRFGSSITVVVVDDDGIDKTESLAFLNDFSAKARVPLEIKELAGSVFEEVLKLEKEGNYDLILQGSHGSNGWKSTLMGSNAFKVVIGSDCPVISVTEAASSPELKNIILPLADSRSTRQKVPYCIELAKAFGATIHILGISKDSGSETKKRVRSYVLQTERYLLERGIPCTTKEEYGVKVPEACVEYGEEMNAGLMLMMTETESAGIFMGTYAQQMVNNSTIPIMTIHSRDTKLAGAAGY